MNELIKQDIIAVVHDSIKCIEKENYIALRKLSDETVHGASIFQEEDSVTIAVLIYSLYKIIERGKNNKKDIKAITLVLRDSLENLRKDKIDKYRKSIQKALSLVSKIDSKLKLYAEEVIKQAEIKKGSKLYDHGISLSRAAEMLGVSKWELMDYLGKTRVSDTWVERNVKDRYNFAKKLFNI